MTDAPHATPFAVSEFEVDGFDIHDEHAVDRFLIAGASAQAATGRIVDDLESVLDLLSHPELSDERLCRGFVVRSATAGDVGRCLALTQRAPGGVGVVTLWDVINAPAAQTALLRAARSWLRSRRCDVVHAPVDVLHPGPAAAIASGASDLALLEPAAPFAPEVAETLGFMAGERAQAMSVDLSTTPLSEPSRDVVIRGLRADHTDLAVRDMADLIESSGAETTIPPRAALTSLLRRLGPLAVGDLIQFAITRSGDMAGFALAYPDHAHEVRDCDGDWSRLGRRRLARLRRPQRVVLHTVFVDHRLRGRGIGAALANSVAEEASRRRHAELRLIGVPIDPVAPLHRIATRLGGVPVGPTTVRFAQTIAGTPRAHDVLARAMAAAAQFARPRSS